MLSLLPQELSLGQSPQERHSVSQSRCQTNSDGGLEARMVGPNWRVEGLRILWDLGTTFQACSCGVQPCCGHAEHAVHVPLLGLCSAGTRHCATPLSPGREVADRRTNRDSGSC